MQYWLKKPFLHLKVVYNKISSYKILETNINKSISFLYYKFKFNILYRKLLKINFNWRNNSAINNWRYQLLRSSNCFPVISSGKGTPNSCKTVVATSHNAALWSKLLNLRPTTQKGTKVIKNNKEFKTAFNFPSLRINSFMTEVPSYINQSIDLLCKSIDRFLYDRYLCHERVNLNTL